MTDYIIRQNSATVEQIIEHFGQNEAAFVASLSAKMVIPAYAEKITRLACRIEAWRENNLIGLVASYFNLETKCGFITNISVLPAFMRCGIGSQLLIHCIAMLQERGAREIMLEVEKYNIEAQAFYIKQGFSVVKIGRSTISMIRYCGIIT